MAVKTGVDIVTQILDQTAAGASSVERNVREMGARVEKAGDGIGKKLGANIAGAIISGMAAAGIDKALEEMLVSQRTGEAIGTSLLQGITESLRSIPVAGPLGELLTRGLGGSLPGERSAEVEEGMRQTQEMQQRQRRQQEIEERAQEGLRRKREQEEERQRKEQERIADERRQDEERRAAEEQRRRQEEERRRQEEQREQERLAEEQRRESERVASEQARRTGAVADSESRLAGVVDSRGLSGRAAAFVQGRSEVGQLVQKQDLANRLQKEMADRLKQIAEQLDLTVVGN